RLLQQAMRDAGVSECSMEKGEMRCEPNVNLVRGDKWATGISELKNLNSFAACRDAVEYEMERQKEADDWHPPHEMPPRHTLGWDDAKKVSVPQRSKESAADYRYFPEPDLPVLPRASLKSVVRDAKKALEDLAVKRESAAVDLEETASRLGLTKEQSSLLLERDVTGGLFRATADAAVEAGVPVVEAGRTLAGWFQGPLSGWVNGQGGDWSAVKATAADLSAALVVQRDRKATAQVVKEHLLSGDWLGEGGDPLAHLDGKGLLGGTDTDAVRTACEEVLAENPDIVEKIKAGKGAAKGALVGMVMKKTRGTANPGEVNGILDELLGG
ncbi:MAG: Asp-tRNA(Asn)/Glu-tRNA(Gln) amidotransferase subunit GatB, partial [Planctomycetota bacterium]